MRKVFTSARLENVERVAKLLEDDGIEVRITNGRSYKGGIHGNFSYRGEGNKMPEVWVVRSADQPRARAMLRSEEHTSELPSLMRISYAVFCLKTKQKIVSNEPNL